MYKDKLIEILKTNPEVKKDMEELKFGCVIQCNDYRKTIYKIIDDENCIELNKDWYSEDITKHNKIDVFDNNSGFKIIWTLQERHLRMYCNSKWLFFCMWNWFFIREWWIDRKICKIDNTKDFDQQENEVYEAIYNFLKT